MKLDANVQFNFYTDTWRCVWSGVLCICTGWTQSMYVCMYVCMSENLYPARLKQKKSQSRRGLKQTETSSVPVWTVQWTSQLSAERTGEWRLFQILAPATAKLRSPNVLLVRRTTNVVVSDDRSMRRPESAMSWQSSVVKKSKKVNRI